MRKIKETSDVYLAAVFLAMGAKYEKVDRTDTRHQKFFFSSEVDDVYVDEQKQVNVVRGIDFDLVENQYANEELLVNAVKYKQAIQRMKSIIHSG